ncbi:hypothetical protein ACS0TY_028924 [Phlomoides rotata]
MQAIPTYVMSYFRIPTTLCRDIEAIIARFWWGVNEDRSGFIGKNGRNFASQKRKEG